jgi:hypothetical protein
LRLDFATLADGADSAGRKLHILGGGLRRIDTPDLPWVGTLAIAAQFTAELEEAGSTYPLAVDVVRPDGALLLGVRGLTLQLPPEDKLGADWTEISTVSVIKVAGAPFEIEGWYSFRLSLLEDMVAELRLRIVKGPGPARRDVTEDVTVASDVLTDIESSTTTD